MATKRQVESKLRELTRRLGDADAGVRDSLARSMPDARIIELSVTDLGITYWSRMLGGTLSEVTEGRPQRADIRVRVASDDLVQLVDGRRSLFSSYLSGQVKIDASLSDLMRLRKLA